MLQYIFERAGGVALRFNAGANVPGWQWTDDRRKRAAGSPNSPPLLLQEARVRDCVSSKQQRVCLDAKNTQIFLHGTRHIESLDICMEH
jgi:hypothetical protein